MESYELGFGKSSRFAAINSVGGEDACGVQEELTSLGRLGRQTSDVSSQSHFAVAETQARSREQYAGNSFSEGQYLLFNETL
jgi:hypothetical protein